MAVSFEQRVLGKMGHIARLFGDAQFLLSDDRAPGAAIMAALAYEELGKLVLDVWQEWGIQPEGKARNNHDRKQRAVASLLLVADLYPHAKEMRENMTTDEAAIARRVEQLQSPGKLTLPTWVILGGLEKFKHLAMYWDRDQAVSQLTAADIKSHRVSTILDVIDPALDYLRDATLRLASVKIWDATAVRGGSRNLHSGDKWIADLRARPKTELSDFSGL